MRVFLKLIKLIMEKILKVIKPFYVMEVGDEFILSQNGKEYVSNYSEEYSSNDENDTMNANYTSNFVISTEYANALVRQGYLSEVKPKVENSYVNVFDEIDSMTNSYSKELKNLDEDCSTYPACLKLEKETVLKNLIKVLTHLKSFKRITK